MKRPIASVQSPGFERSAQPLNQDESKWPFYLVLIALLFEFGRPQYVIPGMKGIPIASVVDVLIAVTLFTTGKLNFKDSQTTLWVALLALMFVHVPIAVNNFYAAMTLKDMGLNLILYLGVINYVNSLGRWRTLMSFWLRIHILLSAFGIASGGTGVGGWLGDENDFCMAINMVVPFAFFMMNAAAGPTAKNVYIALLCVFIMTIVATLSRGGFIGLAAVGAYCWLRASKKIGALFVLAVVAMFMVAVAPDTYWGEIKSSFSDETIERGTGEDRLYMWGIGFEMFLSNPVIGVGQGNFPWAFEEYEAGRTRDSKSRAGRQAHSLYFTLLPELGLVGVIIFGSLLWRNFKDARLVEKILKNTGKRQEKELCNANDHAFLVNLVRAIEGSFIAYFVTSIFISTLWYPSFWIMTAFMVALRNTVVVLATTHETPVDPLGTIGGREVPARVWGRQRRPPGASGGATVGREP